MTPLAGGARCAARFRVGVSVSERLFLVRLTANCAIQEHARSGETCSAKHKQDQYHTNLVGMATKVENLPLVRPSKMLHTIPCEQPENDAGYREEHKMKRLHGPISRTVCIRRFHTLVAKLGDYAGRD